MNSIKSTPAPTVFNQAPHVATLGQDFFVFYGMGNGTTSKVCATIYDHSDNTWRTATMNYGQTFPAYASNGKIKTLVVGSSLFCVYEQFTNSLVIMEITSPMDAKYKNTYTTMNVIGDYALYTDGNYLFLVTNEAGTIYSQRFNGKGFDTKIQINLSGGQASSAPAANHNSQVEAMLENNLLHVVYVASTGLVDAFQLTSNQWTTAMIELNGSNYLGLQLIQYQNQLVLVTTGSSGWVDVFQFFSEGNNYWPNQYSSGNTVVASSKAQAGSNQFGFFISYADQQGRIQCIYCLNDINFYQVQIGGPGAPSGFVPQAPAAAGPVGVGMYGPFYHVCYLGANNMVYDVFWAFAWYGAQLYPTPPSATLNLSAIQASNEKMFETVA